MLEAFKNPSIDKAVKDFYQDWIKTIGDISIDKL